MGETVTEPHVLVINARVEEFQGHDGEFYDYEVKHPESCGKEVVTDADFGIGGDGNTSYYRYTCLVESEIDHVGLDGLTDCGRVRLEPGEYKIEGWSQHFAATPWRSEDWDGGLRIIEWPH